METKEKSEKLRLWQQRLSHSETAYQKQLNKMDGREKQYLGDRVLRPLTENDTSKCGKKETPHVRNITAELIEAQVSSDIPQPKVTARRKEDEPLAALVEDVLRAELHGEVQRHRLCAHVEAHVLGAEHPVQRAA